MDHLSEIYYSSSENNLHDNIPSASTHNYLLEAIRPPSPFASGWASVDPRTCPNSLFIMSHMPGDISSPPLPDEAPLLPLPDNLSSPTTKSLSKTHRRSSSSDSSSSDMSSKDSFTQLPILKQGTFPMWEMGIQNLFEAKQLDHLLLPDSVIPSGKDATKEEIADYREKRGRAMTFILGSLDDVNKARITRGDTPYTAYTKLCKHHGSNEGILTASVIAEITSIRMGSDSLSQFLTKIHLLHQNFAIYTSDDEDLKLSSKMLGLFLLNSLSSTYAVFKTQALKQIKTLKVEDLLAELDILASAEKSDENQKDTTALAATSNQKRSGGNKPSKSS